MKIKKSNMGVLALATGNEPRPIEDCFWIVPEQFLAGEYPRVKSKLMSQQKIEALLSIGISCFIDHTKLEDELEPYVERFGIIGKKKLSDGWGKAGERLIEKSYGNENPFVRKKCTF